MSAPQTPLSTLALSPNPDLEHLQDILGAMRGALGTLGMTFDHLGTQHSRVAPIAPAMERAQQIQALQKQMIANDKRQDDQIEEIKALLKDVLKDQVMNHLKEMISKHIAEIIAEEVKKGVAEELGNKYLPPSLIEQVDGHKAQLEDVRRALTNSEARRANSLLRTHHVGEPLHPLIMANGKVSDKFPRDLATLFGLEAEAAKLLMEEYEIPGISEVKEKNLNSLMIFFGVAYKMVPTLQV